MELKRRIDAKRFSEEEIRKAINKSFGWNPLFDAEIVESAMYSLKLRKSHLIIAQNLLKELFEDE